jgi:hypothetical protein
LRIVGDLAVCEALDRALVIVVGVGETDSSVGLGGHQNQLLVRATLAADEGLVDLHERAERLAVRAHHCRAQLMQPRPRRLVGADKKFPLAD